MNGLSKVIRAVVGLAIVVVVLFTLNSFYGEYKVAAKKEVQSSKTATSTPTGGNTITPATGQHALILVAGVPMNGNATDSAKTLRVLKKGEDLVLLGVVSNGWLQVKDASGEIGFIQNAPANVKIQK